MKEVRLEELILAIKTAAVKAGGGRAVDKRVIVQLIAKAQTASSLRFRKIPVKSPPT